MKTPFRLPVSAATLAALVVLGTGVIRADDDQSRRAAAENLVVAMQTEKMISANTTRLLAMVDRFGQGAAQQGTLTPEQTDMIKKAEDEARDTIRKELGYDALKEEFIKGYTEGFSEAELKELTAFYKSPTGQKLLEKQPEITDKVGKAAQGKMQTVMPGVVAKLRETAQKVMPPPPTPATVVPAPGTPAAPQAPGALTTPMSPTTPVPPTTPMPPTAPARPTAVTPPVTTNPVPAMPTPLPSVSGASTPSAQ